MKEKIIDMPVVMVDALTHEVLVEADNPRQLQLKVGLDYRSVYGRCFKDLSNQRSVLWRGRKVKFTERKRLRSLQPAPGVIQYKLVEDGKIIFTGSLQECKDERTNFKTQKIYLDG